MRQYTFRVSSEKSTQFRIANAACVFLFFPRNRCPPSLVPAVTGAPLASNELGLLVHQRMRATLVGKNESNYIVTVIKTSALLVGFFRKVETNDSRAAFWSDTYPLPSPSPPSAKSARCIATRPDSRVFFCFIRTSFTPASIFFLL